MGTLLGVLFIAGAAAAGVFVGTRSTVMDGRMIADKLGEALEGQGITVWCDRRIRVGVQGAEFACVFADSEGRRKVWYRMSRDGSLEQTRVGEVEDGAL
ncbi:MAG TPA: hypothetical protein VK932_14465 [Kofleriaceae bacterium]|nr:hypothetical protein [Kofleriaceae bacterium]